MPVIGLHSVMLRPDSVRRVTPPTTITANTNQADPISHFPTPGGDSTGNLFASWVVLTFEEKNLGSNRGDLRMLALATEDVGLWGCDSAE